MPGDIQVAVTREGALGALKLLMIVLAGVIFWESGIGINQEFNARGLVTAPPFLKAASKLIVGTETTAAIQQRAHDFWVRNHRLIGLIAVMAITILLTMRYLLMGRVLDYLYLESPVSDRRIYSGFVANIFLVLTHAGIIYGIVLVSREGRAAFVPLVLAAFFAFNLLWSIGIFLSARAIERHALRGVKFLALTSAAALWVLYTATGAMAGPARDPALRGSELMILGAAVALAACAADAIIQGMIYCRRPKPPLPSGG
ncbi:MAG: hypothetical protein ACLQVA_01110 [Candidatus Brocadiia bacterium]